MSNFVYIDVYLSLCKCVLVCRGVRVSVRVCVCGRTCVRVLKLP